MKKFISIESDNKKVEINEQGAIILNDREIKTQKDFEDAMLQIVKHFKSGDGVGVFNE
jgi:hypothetical protein